MVFDEKYSDGQYRKTADNAKLMNLLHETNSTIFFTDIQEGTGKHEGKLGAFHVEGNDDGKFFSLSVGSGLTDEQRDSYWESRDALIGRLIEVRADAVTQNEDGEYYSLRFPRFKSFRGFEKDEKI